MSLAEVCVLLSAVLVYITFTYCCGDVRRSDLKAGQGGSRDGLADSSRLSSCTDVQPALEVRVYRRSTETLAMLDDRRRAQSLPRGIDLNRSVASDLQTSTTNSRRGSVSAAGHGSRSASRKASARSSVVSIGAFKGQTPCVFCGGYKHDSTAVRQPFGCTVT